MPADPAHLLRRAAAARRARRWPEAEASYREAAEALEGRAEAGLCAQLWTQCGRAAWAQGALDRAEEALGRSASLARDAHQEGELGLALGMLGQVASARGEAAVAAAYHQEALDVARRLEDLPALALNVGSLGQLALARGDHLLARRLLEEAHSAYRALGEGDNAAQAQNALGEVARAEGDLEGAERAFRGALAIWEEGASREGQSLALTNLGNLARARGDLDAAAGLLTEAVSFAHAVGDVRGEGRARVSLGHVAWARGDRAAARQAYERARDLHQAHGLRGAAAIDLVNLANLALEEGRLLEARDAYQGALAPLAQAGQRRTALDVRCLQAQVDARLGDLAQAEASLRAAEREATAMGALDAEARITFNLAAVAYARGGVAEALPAFRAGVAHLDALGRPLDQIAALLALADAESAGGDAAAARAAAQRSGDLAEQHGAARERVEATAAQARAHFVADPQAEGAAEALAEACAALDAAEHRLAALNYRLTLADLRPELVDLEVLRQDAAALGSRPLQIEVESLTASAPRELAALSLESDRLGLGLLWLRVARRHAAALERAGDADGASQVRAQALHRALAWGACAEAERLRSSPPPPAR